MSNEHDEVVKQVCCDVFEQLAFMFGEELDKDLLDSDSNVFIRATMQFTGDQTGDIEIIVPAELAESLAYNILGFEEGDELEQGASEDALKELLNTICGRIVTEMYGETSVFDLTVPRTKEISNEQWKTILAEQDYMAIDIEDNPVLLSITIH